MKLLVNAVTGKWYIVIKAGEKELNHYQFSVEDFLPERMGLSLQPGNNMLLTPEQDLNIKVNGWYLYGVPAS